MTLRKFSLLFSTSLLLLTGLAACGGEEAAPDAAGDAAEAPAADSQAEAPAGGDASSGSGSDSAAPAVNAGMDATATVGFVGLTDGTEVSSPLKVCLEVTGVSLEKSGEVKAGYGHHHILVNPTAEEVKAITEGTMTAALVKDETHVHLGDGGDCTELTLSAGNHQLMAVVADGAHVPMNPPVFNQVNIVVK